MFQNNKTQSNQADKGNISLANGSTKPFRHTTSQ
uniref:Uncharacterized protein n=1 Tax=Setaria italica TaxID=4555 RepID=K3XUN5_SETIT